MFSPFALQNEQGVKNELLTVPVQHNLFIQPALLPLADAKVHYYPQFLLPSLADQLFARLRSELAWHQAEITLGGRKVLTPRLQAWYGDEDCQYQYSGLNMQPLAWHNALLDLKRQCELHCQHHFNAVLANLYRNGQDSMGWHSDNEPELGMYPLIASISLGEARMLHLRHRSEPLKYRLLLEHGSLLVMSQQTQQYWQHAIPKSRIEMGERINLTFRRIENVNRM
jgi:alkylated DNA repair dioxygenase AlkB